jgi:hypothetical protein
MTTTLAHIAENLLDKHLSARMNAISNMKLYPMIQQAHPAILLRRHPNDASSFIRNLLEDHMQNLEAQLLDDFMKSLVVSVCEHQHEISKSIASGIDLEFVEVNKRYCVMIKTSLDGVNISELAKIFENAATSHQSDRPARKAQGILGICLGRGEDVVKRQYTKKIGQSFWQFVSGDETFYDTVLEIAYDATKHYEWYVDELTGVHHQLYVDFKFDFCHPNGHIDWAKVIAFNTDQLKHPSILKP